MTFGMHVEFNNRFNIYTSGHNCAKQEKCKTITIQSTVNGLNVRGNPQFNP